MAENSDNEHEIELGGITMESYDMRKHMWNTIHGGSYNSLMFFDFCVHNWLQMKPLYGLAVDSNQGYLFETVYCFFRDMVVVGAQSELERIRGRWNCTSEIGTYTVRHLRGWRFHASADYGPEPLVADTEEEYYADIEDYVPPSPPEPLSEDDT